MRTMVVVNHPYEGSFCHALADAAAAGAGGSSQPRPAKAARSSAKAAGRRRGAVMPFR